MTTTVPPRGYRFGNFELDLATGELRRRGLKVRLRGRPIDILALLLERRGAIVSRDELRTRLWTPDTFVDFDHGLNSAMNKLRDALNDGADNPRFIETIPRRGYRFIAPIEVVAPPPDAPAASVVTAPISTPDQASARPSPPTPPPAGGPLGRHMWGWAATVAVIVTAISLGLWWQYARTARAGMTRAMLIVLPFENLSHDTGQDFFSDGITDEMIGQLGALDPSRLGVIARTTSMQYKGSRKGVMEIGRELGVDYLLEGSVRRDAQRVRITARLVDVKSQTQLWTETYERDLRDVLMLQRDVAERIAQSLAGGVLSPLLARASRPLPTFAAYELVLRGRALRQLATEDGTRECATTFEKAVAMDPGYAPSHSGLADCYRLLGAPGWEVGPPSELLERARTEAERALQLDPELPEGHAVTGMVLFNFDWDLEGADRELQRAIALNPSDARAHQYRSAVLQTQGRFSEAVASARRAQELDPLSPTESTTLGVRLYYAGQADDALAQFERTLRANPGFPVAHWGMAATLLQRGRHDQAIVALRRAVDLSQRSAYMRAWLSHGLAVSGHRAEADAIHAEITAQARKQYVSPFLFALMASGFGERDEALSWLEATAAARSGWIPFVPVEPELAWLRDDPRFQAIVSRVRR